MRTCFWLKGDGQKRDQAILIYDFEAVEDFMLVVLYDEEVNGPVAIVLYQQGPGVWEIEADRRHPERIEHLISLLEEYFSDKEYSFHKAVHQVL